MKSVGLSMSLKKNHNVVNSNVSYVKKESNSLSDFLRHKKLNNKESTPIFKQFRTGECTFGNNKCWFIYERDDENTNIKEGNEKTLENDEIVQKMFKIMENIT